MGISKRDLEQAFVDYGKKYGGLKEDYFALLYLAQEFNKPVEVVARQVAFGGNDYGLDAFHFDTDKKNLYLYQFKWSENHKLFKQSLERLIQAGMEQVFGNPKQDVKANQFLIQLKSAIEENQAVVDRVLMHCVFNGDPEAADASAVLDSLREDLESKRYLIAQCFERTNVQLGVQYIGNDGRRGERGERAPLRQFRVHFAESLTADGPAGEKMHVGLLRLMDLHRMYKAMGHRLLSRNIRYGLSPDKAPNRSIRKALAALALDGSLDPAAFVFNHNGVTLSAEKIEVVDGECCLTEPRVLNGAQTITSLDRFLEDNKNHPALEGNGRVLAKIQVLAKIISDAPEPFVTNVTVCNNRQNPVEPWHLRASDRVQLELQDKFQDDLGIYYERQEGAFEDLSDSDLEEMGVDQTSRAIQIRKLAQTFLASQGEIGLMSHLTDAFEDEETYRDTFRESFLTSDSRRILLAYKIHFRLNAVIREVEERGAQKYFYLRRARNLVWALLIQAVLNDGHRAKHLEDFGTSLVMEADYTELLRRLATTRVKPMLSAALSDERSQERLRQEKYDVLRTKATYKRCMDEAWESWQWKKLAL